VFAVLVEVIGNIEIILDAPMCGGEGLESRGLRGPDAPGLLSLQLDGIQLKEGLKLTPFDLKAINFPAKYTCIIDLAHFTASDRASPGRLPAPRRDGVVRNFYGGHWALLALAVGKKFRMLWRRGTGPKRHGRACPGYPRVSAQRTTARSGEVEKALFLRPLRPRAALTGLVSGTARRGWPEQARPGRERLRDESEAARQQLRF
jgi:hypothetical protein